MVHIVRLLAARKAGPPKPPLALPVHMLPSTARSVNATPSTVVSQPRCIERLIVDPIEDAINELDDIKRMDSRSLDGVGIIQVEFEWDQDADEKYDEVVREVNRIRADLTERLPIADAEYGGFVCAGTFTHGHVGPVCFPELLRITRPGAVFACGAIGPVLDGAGFGSALARLTAAGRITPIVWVLLVDRLRAPEWGTYCSASTASITSDTRISAGGFARR